MSMTRGRRTRRRMELRNPWLLWWHGCEMSWPNPTPCCAGRPPRNCLWIVTGRTWIVITRIEFWRVDVGAWSSTRTFVKQKTSSRSSKPAAAGATHVSLNGNLWLKSHLFFHFWLNFHVFRTPTAGFDPNDYALHMADLTRLTAGHVEGLGRSREVGGCTETSFTS